MRDMFHSIEFDSHKHICLINVTISLLVGANRANMKLVIGFCCSRGTDRDLPVSVLMWPASRLL